MEVVLNIYGKKNGKKQIIKTYKSEDYEVSFGVLEDLIGLMQSVTENTEETDMMQNIIKVMGDIKPLMLDVFEGLTKDELRNASGNEVMKVAMTLITYGLQSLTNIGGSKKK